MTDIAENNSRKTFFYDKHVELGARMAPFGGFLMPIQYEGILKEHQAVRTAAGIFDTCHMGEFQIRDGQVVPDLEKLVSCPIADMKSGQCRYGMLCAPDGGVLDDLLVYRMGDKDFMLVVNAGTQDNDFAWIRAHLSPETKIENLSDTTAKIDLQGPKSPAIMQALVSDSIADLKYYHFMKNRYQGHDIIVSRTGYTGEVGYEVYGEAEVVLSFWDDCLRQGVVPAGLGARDTLRLEMGMPLYGHELSEKRSAGESGFSRAIAGKSFIGSDVVLNPARQAYRLVGMALEGRRAARHGDSVVTAAGEPAGVVTSGSFGPSVGQAIALGYIRKELAEPDTAIAVETARTRIAGKITKLPFYRQGTARTGHKKG